MFGYPNLNAFLRSITGLSIPWFGVQWAPPPDESKVVYTLIVRLADRRVLFDSACGKDRRAMIESIGKVRETITVALVHVGQDSRARPFLESARDACQRCQTFLEQYSSDGYGGPEEDLYIAIGEMRGLVGRQLMDLCVGFGVDIRGEQAKLAPGARGSTS